jgi:NTE family protein
MGDYRVGLVAEPDVKLSTAVAASSAFPPVLSPLTLQVGEDAQWQSGSDLALPEYRREVVLSDGGVYDNLALETAYKRYRTLLVSDGGQKMTPEETPSQDWGRHSLRILDLVDNQVRSLRKRQLIESYTRQERTGCYWGILSDFNDYKLDLDPLGCASRDPAQIAATPTRLQAIPDLLQERLINWGYAITDAAIRKHFKIDLEKMYDIAITPPSGFPYPSGY